MLTELYRISDKGLRFLHLYNEIVELLNSSSSDEHKNMVKTL
jgi:hypothetical protein